MNVQVCLIPVTLSVVGGEQKSCDMDLQTSYFKKLELDGQPPFFVMKTTELNPHVCNSPPPPTWFPQVV